MRIKHDYCPFTYVHHGTEIETYMAWNSETLGENEDLTD